MYLLVSLPNDIVFEAAAAPGGGNYQAFNYKTLFQIRGSSGTSGELRILRSCIGKGDLVDA